MNININLNKYKDFRSHYMLTSEKREELYNKFNVDSNDIKYTTYIGKNQNDEEVRGIDLEIISLKINIRSNMSDSLIYNFKRCLRIIRCILDKYNID